MGMWFLNRKSSFGNSLILAAFTILGVIILFSLITLVINALIFIIPIGVGAWLIYKASIKVKSFFKERSKKDFFPEKGEEVYKTHKHFEDEIKNRRVVDVDYTEL
jgi:hypothetical protein